jgi:hypothetical protein
MTTELRTALFRPWSFTASERDALMLAPARMRAMAGPRKIAASRSAARSPIPDGRKGSPLQPSPIEEPRDAACPNH